MVQPLSATQTVDRARTALQNGKGAGLPELLKLLEAITTDLAKATISEIAEIISQDAAVTARLLAVANTLSNNPNIAPLSSVDHAIHQIGFQRIRSLALSLMLLESAGGAGNPPEQREAAAHALCAGLLAQGAAHQLGTVDPETAFACGALRQFGYIVLAGVSIEHYRAALERLKTKPEDIAFRGMFGVTPLELARKLLAGAKLPEEITRGLRDTEPAQVARMTVSNDSRVLGIADLCGRLARLALDEKSGSDDFGQKSRLLARQYDRLLPGACELIEPSLMHVDERMTAFNKTAEGGSAVPFASVMRIKSRVQKEEVEAPAPAAEGTTATAAGAPVADGTAVPAATGEPADTPLAGQPAGEPKVAEAVPGAAEAIAAATTGPTDVPPSTAPAVPAEPAASPDQWAEQLQKSSAFAAQEIDAAQPVDPWVSVVGALRESFGAYEAWVFLPSAKGDRLELAHGSGGHWITLQESALLSRTERTVFGVCIARHETVAVHDTGEATIRNYLPDWFKQKDSLPGSFLLIPLSERGQGLVLIGWPTPRRVVPTAAQTELARLLIASVTKPAAAAGSVVPFRANAA